MNNENIEMDYTEERPGYWFGRSGHGYFARIEEFSPTLFYWELLYMNRVIESSYTIGKLERSKELAMKTILETINKIK